MDDDDISRAGITALLTATPGLRVLAALDHRAALRWDGWPEADVVLVDAADERRDDDQFPGIGVIERVRADPRLRGVAVVVLTGHFIDGAVRRRAREAGADYFYYRGDLADAAALRRAVLGPGGPPVPDPEDPEEQIRLGVSAASRVNAAVRYALAEDLPEKLAQRPRPHSRIWARLRRDFNDRARLAPMTSDGRTPDREQELPSLPQISRFLAWATRVKTRRPPPDD